MDAGITSGKLWLSLSPTYISPTSAFSGLLGPAGSRHVDVELTGSTPPLSTVLYATWTRFEPPAPFSKRILQ